ncbi:MAG: dephospho-CoA kinase [Desulfobulbaceae bacterium]|jgi:dephospho-CoA kinase|nr:dephospho-CoA kinase [Desulfobulbaceae bacterium]
MNIAMTGSIGAGKSTVAAMLAGLLPALLIDTDQICRRLMATHEAGWRGLRAVFPRSFFADNGELRRAALRQAVFFDDGLRRQLEGVLHPLVAAELEPRLAANDAEFHLVEVPLLFEIGWQHRFDAVVAVYIPEEAGIERVAARDRVSVEQIRKILAAQLPADDKAARADWVIDNRGDMAASFTQALWLVAALRRAAADNGRKCR